MLRQNPRKILGGIPRYSGTARTDIVSATEALRSGFSYYHNYQYNISLPVFCRLSMKRDSISKSLRYPFLKYTGIKIIGGLSVSDFIFAMTASSDADALAAKMMSTRSQAVLASFSHVSDINPYMPEDKKTMSADFFQSVGDMPSDVEIFISVFDSEHKEILESFLKQELGAASVRRHSFIGGSLIIRMPDMKTKLDKLLTHCLVRSVSACPQITLTEQYLRHEELPYDCITPREFGRSYPLAGVVDSGLADNSLLREWEMDSVILTEDRDQRHSHGTFVTGRLLKDGDKFGGIMFLNIEMLPSSGSLDIDAFYIKMRTVLKQYHQSVKIYNLSVSSDTCALLSEYSQAAYALDILQYEFDVLFVISAGNYDALRTGSGPIFGEDRITTPAESIHSLTVGSVAQTDTNIQIKDSPSLFTRRGPGTGHSVKPDVCAYGGAHESRMGRLRPVGVFSIGSRNELAEDTGTSHAAPRAAAIAAKIYYKYSHAFKSPDMTRAIIIHYTHLRKNTSPGLYTGYGILPEDDRPIDADYHSAVYLNGGYVSQSGITEIPDVPVPDVLFDGETATCRICATLVYKPETDIRFPSNYACVNIDLSVGYYKDGAWQSVMTQKNMETYSDNDLGGHDMREMQKWHPVKVYEKALRRKVLPRYLTMRLTPSRRDFYTKRTKIDYSLVLSFSDETKNVFRSAQKECDDYNGLLEPAFRMWKNC